MVNRRIEALLMWTVAIAGWLTLKESIQGLVAHARSVESLLWALGAALGSFLWLSAIILGIMRDHPGHSIMILVVGMIFIVWLKLTLG